MNSAQALVWCGGTSFRLLEVELPTVGEGETLVELTGATICGSDRHTVLGRRSQPCPSILGHEGVGIVCETRNPALSVGQRVVFSVTAPCMRCDRCHRGMTAKCRNLKKTGHESFHSDWALSGTYATYILLRQYQPVVPVPDLLSDAAASVTACAGATVMAAAEQVGKFRDQRVLVMGVGMLGLIAIEVARKAGACEIVTIDREQSRLELAEQLGARVCFAKTAETSVEETKGGCDIALEFSGSQFGVETCIQSLDIGGRGILVGSVTDCPTYPLNPEWMVRGWRTVTGVHNYEPRHLQQAVDFLTHSEIPWQKVSGEPMSLIEVPEALTAGRQDRLREFVSCSPS